MYKREIRFGIDPEFRAYRYPKPVAIKETGNGFAIAVAIVAAVAFVLVWAII